MNRSEIFSRLHQQESPLLLGNAWNAHSARLLEKNGYAAIGTSSAAVAYSLGYEDDENIPFHELLSVVERITASINIPLSVDLEGGYSEQIVEVINHIEWLYHAGVAGINLEDSRVSGGRREIATTEAFCGKLRAIRAQLEKKKIAMFINVRTDAWLLGLPCPLAETLGRIHAYEAAGANGIFVPYLYEEGEIRAITAATALPVNLLCREELPSFTRLAALGVKRISMGHHLFRSTYGGLETLLEKIRREGSFSALFV